MKDLTNSKIYKWTFLERRGSNISKNALWLAVCECGTERIIAASEVRVGRSKGCRKCKDIHGKYGKLTHHRLYGTWCSMRNRCNNKNNKDYYLYGVRGIKVCKRWGSFELFLEDMEPSFKEGLTLDRIDGDKGYFPDNCRWATASEQNLNKRRRFLKKVVFENVEYTIKELSEATGVTTNLIRRRLGRGWDIEEVIKGKTRNVI